jgi:hypothetical protein
MYEQARSFDKLFAKASAPPKQQLENCALVPDRNALLRCIPKGGIGAVFGLAQGGPVKQILDMTEPAQLHIFRFHFDGKGDIPQFAAAIAARRLVFHDCPGLERPPERLDWAYLVGETTTKGVNAQIDRALPLLRHDGLLVFAGYPGVARVARAVNDLAVKRGCDFVAFSASSSDVALRVADGG